MTIEEAADRLLQTYSTYGVRREFLVELLESGVVNYGLSVLAAFNGTRMMLGQQLGVQELLSARDVAEMLDVSEEQAILEIEKAKAELLEQGEDMSKYIISEPEHQKFIVPPTRWTS